jgi:thiol-disulfide isomerase/thioredoxin
MIERLVVLLAVLAVALAVHLAVRRRRDRVTDGAGDHVDPDEVGLDRFPPAGAFVQFSTQVCAPCRVSLNRLAEAVAHHPGDATVVEVTVNRRPQLAQRHGVRSAPTILYVDSTGAVRRRWTRPPERAELESLLEDAARLAV